MEFSRDELTEYAKTFVKELPATLGGEAYVVGLKGSLGAGKTTFVQEVAKALGVKETVTSPTFVIAQRYETAHSVFKHLIHMDAYRLSGEVVDTIGFESYLHNPENLVFVEWPEHLPNQAQLPATALVLEFETVDENIRKVTKHA